MTTGITTNVFNPEPGPSWREHPGLENAVTLSQHFRDHGYFVAGAGKIYYSLQWGPWDENDPDTWDLYLDPGDGSGPIPHHYNPCQIRAMSSARSSSTVSISKSNSTGSTTVADRLAGVRSERPLGLAEI